MARPSGQKAHLDTGDTIEYSLTLQIDSSRSGTKWVKAGVTTTVRENETANQARKRGVDFVENFLMEKFDELQ